VPIELRWFRDVDLSIKADDETVWRFCQERGYLLLTGNRTTKDGVDSLEMTVRRLIEPTSLPVLTISNLKRIQSDPAYCRRCAEQLIEIVVDLEERYRGITRLYLS